MSSRPVKAIVWGPVSNNNKQQINKTKEKRIKNPTMESTKLLIILALGYWLGVDLQIYLEITLQD